MIHAQTEAEFENGAPQKLFQTRTTTGPFYFRYDVSEDGERFLIITRIGEAPTQELTVVVNWQAMLKD